MKRMKDLLPVILLGVGAVVLFLPFLWMVLNSFKTSAEINQTPPTFLPLHFSLAGYIKVLTQVPFFRWLGNSLFVAGTNTLLLLFTSSILGYIFARFEFRGKNLCFFILLASMMIPGQVTLIPSYLLMSKLQWIDTFIALIVPGMIGPFGIFMCRQYVASVPGSLIEAGRIDGAGEFRIYSRIILPEMKPILSALTIFTFMFKWNDYLWPLIIMNTQDKMPVALALTFFSSKHYSELNVVYAASMLIMIPILAVYLLFQKQFVEGLSMTGIK